MLLNFVLLYIFSCCVLRMVTEPLDVLDFGQLHITAPLFLSVVGLHVTEEREF